MTDSDRPALWAALLDAQRHARAVAKTGTNEAQGWDFVTVEDVTRISREALNSAGLVAVLRVPAEQTAGGQHLDSYLHVAHPASGEEARFPVPWPIERPGPQARRAAYAYARKQALVELLALAEPGDPETDATPGTAHDPGGSGKAAPQSRAGSGRTRTVRRTDKAPSAAKKDAPPAPRQAMRPPPAPDLDEPPPAARDGATDGTEVPRGATEGHAQQRKGAAGSDPSPEAFRALHAAYRSAGIVERDERLAHASQALGRDVGSAKDLTGPEVSRLLDALTGPPPLLEEPAPEEPAPGEGEAS